MKNSWKIEEFSAETIKDNIDNKIFVVPKYQRGVVWSDKQRADLMDTIKKGLPFGTILLYKDVDGKYQIIDGLQRSTAIQKFGENPAQFFDEDDIDDNVIKQITDMVSTGGNHKKQADEIKKQLIEWVKEDHTTLSAVEKMQFYKFGVKLANTFANLQNHISEIADLIEPMMQEYQSICKRISDTMIPAIVMEGDQESLPIIFERINTRGLQLTKYQIFNATWSDKKYLIDQKFDELVKANRDRYDTMLDGESTLDNYDPSSFINDKQLSVFEIAFGLGKYFSNKYPHMFGLPTEPKVVDSIGFNLLCGCLGLKNKDAAILQQQFENYVGDDVNAFLTALLSAVNDVEKRLGKFSRFKSNSRKNTGKRPLHSEFQIVAIITSVFIQKYVDITLNENDQIETLNFHFNQVNQAWKKTKKDIFEKNISKIYISEILNDKWKGTGDKKVDEVQITPEIYCSIVDKDDFENTLDNWFEKLNDDRRELSKVTNPKDPELLMLAAVYLNEFSSQQQLDDSVFDIEHLATKKLMKTQLERFNGDLRLPISSFGNLCLLPQYENRSKKERTVYEDKSYLDNSSYSLEEIEEQFTFTTEDQLAWILDDTLDMDEFADCYYSFIKDRFEAMKEKIFDNYEAL